MKKKKIMLVFGTRPEAIKMAPLAHKLKENQENFDVKVCVTSQHREMLDQVLEVFQIIPDIDLNLMKADQDLFDLTSSILKKMKSVFLDHQPDVALVHGDTTTTLATAIASFYSSVPIGHVEAGLRTFNFSSPFPEEFNRQITSKIAKWHFAPTDLSKKNLLSENVKNSSITVTGNTVIDALYWVLKKTEKNREYSLKLEKKINNIVPFNWRTKKYILITTHRRENFGDGFFQICSAIKALSAQYKNLHFVCPVHLNPNINKPIKKFLGGIKNIHLIEPQDYEPFIHLLKNSYFVLTDSGGIQEEAPSLGKPVLVMRDVTERPEAVEAGTVKLVGSNYQKIINGVSKLIDDKNYYHTMSSAHNPYGDGFASDRIIEILKKI